MPRNPPPGYERWSLPACLAAMGWSLVAIVQLAWARRRLARLETADIAALNRQAASRAGANTHRPTAIDREVNKISYIVPRVASRLPWRADCLVQALAAQRWLGASGLASEIVIGVRNDTVEGFESHAWLQSGSAIVTGGDIAPYTVILESSTSPEAK